MRAERPGGGSQKLGRDLRLLVVGEEDAGPFQHGLRCGAAEMLQQADQRENRILGEALGGEVQRDQRTASHPRRVDLPVVLLRSQVQEPLQVPRRQLPGVSRGLLPLDLGDQICERAARRLHGGNIAERCRSGRPPLRRPLVVRSGRCANRPHAG